MIHGHVTKRKIFCFCAEMRRCGKIVGKALKTLRELVLQAGKIFRATLC
jgi:hypothetical protein